IMRILITRAFAWLKISQVMTGVDCYVYDQGEVQIWSQAMDAILGRTAVTSGSDQVALLIRNSIVSTLDSIMLQGPADPVIDKIAGLRSILAREQFTLQTVCSLARPILEVAVNRECERRQIKKANDLCGNIERLNASKFTPPWIASTYHFLRVVGNENIHDRDINKLCYRPQVIGAADMVPILSHLSRAIEYWRDHHLL
ncbi:MAG: DUF4145 domain-containing protein, partial [Planctomycetota bacterium]